MKNILDIASDISETVYITTEDQNRSSKTALINEDGDVAFECEIEVQHDYYNGDRNTGDAYEFDVTGVTVKVLNVFDAEGDVIAVNKIVMAQLEKTIARNLTFEITKKY